MIFPYSKPNPKVQTPEPETQKVEEKKGYLKSQGKSQEKSSQQEKASSAKTITLVVQPTEEIPSTSKPDMMSTPALDEKQVRTISKPSNNEPKKKIENTSGSSANGLVQPESSRKFSQKEEVENEKVSTAVPSSKSEARKIMQKKSNIIEKANQRASALNITKISPKLVFATGASTLRSVRLEEMQVTLVILASTAEDLENSWTTPTLEGVASKVIVLDENRDNESQIEKYLHMAADWVSDEEKRGVAMIHAPEGGVFKKANGSGSSDSRRGEGFAAALCAAYLIKYDGQTAKQALESIK